MIIRPKCMSIEHFVAGKSTEQIIQETIADLDRGLYDARERQEVVSALIIARITTALESPERVKIDELLQDIESRYGNI